MISTLKLNNLKEKIENTKRKSYKEILNQAKEKSQESSILIETEKKKNYVLNDSNSEEEQHSTERRKSIKANHSIQRQCNTTIITNDIQFQFTSKPNKVLDEEHENLITILNNTDRDIKDSLLKSSVKESTMESFLLEGENFDDNLFNLIHEIESGSLSENNKPIKKETSRIDLAMNQM